jgi:hypothetical protein
MNTFLASLVVGLGLFAAPDTRDRPFVDVRINDQPVHLTIDTCSSTLAVFSSAADRIGLKYHKPEGFDPNRVRPGRVRPFRSDPCRLTVENQNGHALRIDEAEGRRRIRILEIPAGLDGLIGWPNIAKNILHLDWGQKTLESLPAVPSQALPWHNLKLYSPFGVHVLALRVPELPGPQKAVYIDTGDFGGVEVSSALWKEIVAQSPGQPMAIEGWYTPAAGSVLHRICWLKTLKLGAIELHDVPVSEMPEVMQHLPSCAAIVGLHGLTRLEVIVDGRHNRAYVRTQESYPKQYDYNRAGVAFLPVDNRSSDLVATVLESGPAYEAGIRDGDKLLRVNGRDITGWRNDPNGMPEGPSAFAQPAGTRLTLTIQREGQALDVTVVLRELLPVEARPASPQEDKN